MTTHCSSATLPDSIHPHQPDDGLVSKMVDHLPLIKFRIRRSTHDYEPITTPLIP